MEKAYKLCAFDRFVCCCIDKPKSLNLIQLYQIKIGNLSAKNGNFSLNLMNNIEAKQYISITL